MRTQRLNMVADLHVEYCVKKTNKATASPVLGTLTRKNGIRTLQDMEMDILLCRLGPAN